MGCYKTTPNQMFADKFVIFILIEHVIVTYITMAVYRLLFLT
jgi:hypothetical protein